MKDKNNNNNIRPMGFGLGVYKNFDPRARNIKKECEAVLSWPRSWRRR